MSAIPEIDIKIEQIKVTASTRTLKARWHPELSQDLIAYHILPGPCMIFMTTMVRGEERISIFDGVRWAVTYESINSDMHTFLSMSIKR